MADANSPGAGAPELFRVYMTHTRDDGVTEAEVAEFYRLDAAIVRADHYVAVHEAQRGEAEVWHEGELCVYATRGGIDAICNCYIGPAAPGRYYLRPHDADLSGYDWVLMGPA